MTHDTKPDECREAFEQWAKTNGLDLTWNGFEGHYLYQTPRDSWVAWRAAYTRTPPQSAVDYDAILEEMATSDKTVMFGTECVIRVDDAMEIVRPYLSQASVSDFQREISGNAYLDDIFDELACHEAVIEIGNECIISVDTAFDILKPYLRMAEPLDRDPVIIAKAYCYDAVCHELGVESDTLTAIRKLKAPTPVSVSLEKCAARVKQYYEAWEREVTPHHQKLIAKAVLDAAGVKYVD